jgi:hypothetical protein
MQPAPLPKRFAFRLTKENHFMIKNPYSAMAAGALILAPGAAFAQTNSTDSVDYGTQEDRVGCDPRDVVR